ncbi:MAG: hypothetical protein SFV24_18995 [Gemmatimonadales bacterium]|nr:hypothetical protein [Gemmatimonadales bacterium]
MPRRPNIVPSRNLTMALPEDVFARLQLYLYSEAEQRVPQGAYQSFFVERINEFFERRAFDTGAGVIYGPPETIEYVKSFFEER